MQNFDKKNIYKLQDEDNIDFVERLVKTYHYCVYMDTDCSMYKPMHLYPRGVKNIC